MQFRAEMYCKKGDCQKGAALYYQLWTPEKKTISWISHVHTCYSRKKTDEMTDEDRQRYLFITYLFATELLDKQKEVGTEISARIPYIHSILKKFDEEMFFKGVTSLPMITPENKKTTLSSEKLKELIQSLSN